jgi:hypothetical protein
MQPAVRRLQDARVRVFEDAPKGHIAATAAVELLREHGVSIHLELYGIAPGRERAHVLRALGARVYPDVRSALDDAVPGWRDEKPRPEKLASMKPGFWKSPVS